MIEQKQGILYVWLIEVCLNKRAKTICVKVTSSLGDLAQLVIRSVVKFSVGQRL